MKLYLNLCCCLLPLLLVASYSGCQKSEDKDEKQGNLIESSDSEKSKQKQDSVSPRKTIALQTDGEFLKKMTELHERANELESQLKFKEAYDVWCEIETLVATQHGSNSWQMTNVKLAKETALKESQFTNSQKRVLLSIGQLQQAITKYVNQKDFSSAYESTLTVSKLTQDLFGNQSHHYGRMQNQLGRICLLNGQANIAISYFESARKILAQQLGDEHPDVESTTFTIGQIHQQTGEWAKALPYLGEAVRLSAKVWGEETTTYASRCHDLGVACQTLKKFKQAHQYLSISAKIREREMGKDHPQLAHNLRNLGVVEEDLKQYKQASENYFRAAEIFAAQLGDDNSFTLDCKIKLSVMYTLMNENAKAETVLREIAVSQKKTLGENNQYFAQTLFRLAMVLGRQKKFDEAEPFFRQALTTQRRLLGDQNPQTQNTADKYALLLERTNRKAAADQLRNGIRNVGFDQDLNQDPKDKK